jgi:hypothetical protein
MKNGRILTAAATLAVALGLVVPAVASAETLTPDANAADLASAMQATDQPHLITSASWPALPEGAPNPSAQDAVGVGDDYAGHFMPDDGSSFAALTNGSVAVADPPNDSTGAGQANETSSRNVNDLSTLEIDVNVPAGDNCLAFDGVFYSEEYPEYVGSEFNDGFIAELDTDDWTYDPSLLTINAPHDFAFDEEGHELTVNSASFSEQGETGLQYDGSTKLLSASTAVTAGPHRLYLSIYDAGDHILDSAMFLDNLRTFTAGADGCQTGAKLADTDGDGIPDVWETEGIRDREGNMLLNLPAMGADPLHKDVFVELDAMKGLALSHQALGLVESAFADAPVSNPDGTTGINLHVDEGPTSVMNPRTGATWGALSDANDDIPFSKYFGSVNSSGQYNWNAFDVDKRADMDPNNTSREAAFHFALSVNRYEKEASSGISRGIPSSDFLIALGPACSPEGTCPGSVSQQAGTFMHELGHNLGLHHGGQVDENYAPNYLSVMNYTFQFSGLSIAPDLVDYSRYGPGDIATVDENDLNESEGFGLPANWGGGQKTRIWCGGAFLWNPVKVGGPVDFNCNGNASENGVSADLHNEHGYGNSAPQPAAFQSEGPLTSYDDWGALLFRGGAIGGNDLGALLPETSESDEPAISTLAQAADELVPPPGGGTGNATDITPTSAVVHGVVNPNGEPTGTFFEYGTSESYGSATPRTEVGSGPASVPTQAGLSGLSPNTTYYYRAVIESTDHLLFGGIQSFTTTGSGSTQPAATHPEIAPAVEPAASAGSVVAAAHSAHSVKTKCPAGKRLKHRHCIKRHRHHHRSHRHSRGADRSGARRGAAGRQP